MASFYDNLKQTFADLDQAAKLKQMGRTSDGHPNDNIINYFQYVPSSKEEFESTQKQMRNKSVYYTPFSWSDGADNIKGMVVTGPSTEGQRILGIELEDGRSLNGTGAQSFFNSLKDKGAFEFAQESKLWDNKADGDWPLQSGNPFDFYAKDSGQYSNVNNEGKGTFRVESPRHTHADEGKQRLSDAMTFFKNLRSTKGWK